MSWLECSYDNYTLFERYERDQERSRKKLFDWDDCEDDDPEDWEDEIYED